jgi:hypothetical protein
MLGSSEPGSRLRNPPRRLLKLIQQAAGADEAPTSQEPFAGFTRLGQGAVAA